MHCEDSHGAINQLIYRFYTFLISSVVYGSLHMPAVGPSAAEDQSQFVH